MPTHDIMDNRKEKLVDHINAETLLRLVQSVPSPKAEPIKLWLAKVGYERMQEMADPARALERARATWQKHGRSDKWIQQRMTGQETRNKLTDDWATHDIMKWRWRSRRSPRHACGKISTALDSHHEQSANP